MSLYETRGNYMSKLKVARRKPETDLEPQKLAGSPYVYIWPNKSEHHTGSTSLKVNGLVKLSVAASCVSHSMDQLQ